MMSPPAGEVHLWKAALDDCTPVQLGEFEELLDDVELARARRFYFERDRRRFIVARGWLRILLGRYLDVAPRRLVFGYTERGKPFLVASPEVVLRFNVSHSGGQALLGFATGRELGVDLEAGERLGDDWPAIAHRYFSPREQVELDATPASERRTAFLHGWARKEAYLKATGLGISDGLQKIEVSLAPNRPARFLSEGMAERWSLLSVGGLPYPAAVAVQKLGPGDSLVVKPPESLSGW